MTHNHLLVFALTLALAACGQSAPDPSGTYSGEFGETLKQQMTIKITPLPNSDGKYSIEQLFNNHSAGTSVLFYDQEKDKFCIESSGMCLTYNKTEGVRLDGDTEFLKRQE